VANAVGGATIRLDVAPSISFESIIMVGRFQLEE